MEQVQTNKEDKKVEEVEKKVEVTKAKAFHKMSIKDPKELITTLGLINKLVNETHINITKDGLQITALDAANVAMVDFKFKSSACTSYESSEDEKIGVDLSKLMPMLKRVDGPMVIEVGDSVVIKSCGKTKKQFTSSIIMLDDKGSKMPELNFTATVKAKSKEIVDSIEDSAIASESASFIAKGNAFGINSQGDIKSVNIDLTTNVNVKGDDPVTGKYAIEYLSKIVTTKLGEDLTLNFSKEYPLKVDYKSDSIELSFILAPRIENN